MDDSAQAFPEVAAESLPWLSVAQMREVDRLMVEDLDVSVVQMMENAGRNLAVLARHLLGGDATARRILVLVGPGGNGGGGLAAARHLAAAGACVEVRLSAPPERLAPATAVQHAIVRRLGLTAGGGAPELVLDALFGYGQEGDPSGEAARLIDLVAGRRVLALDVPSGLELETGHLRAPYVRAEVTLTLALPKEGLRAPGADAAVGRLYLADLSVPPLVYARLGLAYRSPFGSSPIVRIRAGRASPKSTRETR